MHVIKLALLSFITVLLVGCATTSDIENLQTQVVGLKISVAQVASDVKEAQLSASKAYASSTAAEIATSHAAKNAQETSIKLGHLFKKAMMK